MQQERPIVTIRCITYNQEKYIRQCLDGFIMQKTNFKFEAIVHDDASTDSTANIIREYAQRYPNIIKPILETENQYSKGTLHNVLDPLMTGKYIAICEGDDYWTDQYKLQKQVDFLESNPSYFMCFHQSIRHFENHSHPDELAVDIEDRDYSGLELYSPLHRPQTHSVLFRSELYRSEIYHRIEQEKISFGDLTTFLACAYLGKVRGMTDVMGVYRQHQTSMSSTVFSSSAPNEKVLKFAKDNLKLYKIFGKEYKEECTKIYVMDYFNFFMNSLHCGKYRFDILIKVLFTHPIYTILFLIDRYNWHKASNKKKETI